MNLTLHESLEASIRAEDWDSVWYDSQRDQRYAALRRYLRHTPDGTVLANVRTPVSALLAELDCCLR